LTFLSYII